MVVPTSKFVGAKEGGVKRKRWKNALSIHKFDIFPHLNCNCEIWSHFNIFVIIQGYGEQENNWEKMPQWHSFLCSLYCTFQTEFF